MAYVFLLAAIAVYALTFVRRYYGGRLALDVQHDLRTEMFDTLTRLDGRRQDELSTGQVVGRATSDLQLIQGLLFMLPMTIGNVLLFVISLGIMAWLSPPLTLVAVAVAPALVRFGAAAALAGALTTLVQRDLRGFYRGTTVGILEEK